MKLLKQRSSYAKLASPRAAPPPITDTSLVPRVEKRKGCKRFDSEQLHNHRHHERSKLDCLQCRQENAEREKILHSKFKQSKWFCKCGNPIHSEKCPLATMFYDKRRWPGGDGYITAEDNVFLSNLNPRPKWWADALRKPNKPK